MTGPLRCIHRMLHFPRTSLLAVAGLLLALTARGSAAEPATSAAKLVLPPAPASAPIPKDGSGTWRLVLDGAFGKTSLTLILAVSGGRVVDGIGLDLDLNPAWMELDVGGLSATAGSLSGTAVLTIPGVFNSHPERDKRKAFNNEDPGVIAVADLTLAATVGAEGGTGTWTLVLRPTTPKTTAIWLSRTEQRPLKSDGVLTLVRQAPTAGLPQTCELISTSGLGDVFIDHNGHGLRAEFAADGSARRLVALGVNEHQHRGTVGGSATGSLTLRDGRLNGDVTLSLSKPETVGQPATEVGWRITGRAIGPVLAADLVVTGAGRTWRTRALGRWTSAGGYLPLDQTTEPWTWVQDRPADAALVAAAAVAATRPVLPGEPGKRGFWTWRTLVLNHELAVIHPPSFDLRPVAGAAGYRVTLVGKETRTRHVLVLSQPWQPWTEGWDQLPVDSDSTSIEVLDATGAVSATASALVMGVIDKETGESGTIPMPKIHLIKKPSFQGPYAAWPRPPAKAALLAARWAADVPRTPWVRGLVSPGFTLVGGESGASWRAAGQAWSSLAIRALTDHEGERDEAVGLLDHLIVGLQINQRASEAYFPPGIFHCYKGFTPLTRFAGHGLLDILRETGDPRCREMALKLGEGLAATQDASGTWQSWDRKTGAPTPPKGFFNWKHARTFGAAEVLRLLGRIRRELATDRFAATEAKARAYVEREQVAGMFWPINVHHSMSMGYPYWQYVQGACDHIRYLLEDAPVRDVALAEELGRWVEDRAVDWRRADPAGLQPGIKNGVRVAPGFSGGDRYQGEPADNALQAALAFLRLHEATGSALWLAKADALAIAVAWAQDPRTGYVNPGLVCLPDNTFEPYYHSICFINGHCAQLWREFAALRAAVVRRSSLPSP